MTIRTCVSMVMDGWIGFAADIREYLLTYLLYFDTLSMQSETGSSMRGLIATIYLLCLLYCAINTVTS